MMLTGAELHGRDWCLHKGTSGAALDLSSYHEYRQKAFFEPGYRIALS